MDEIGKRLYFGPFRWNAPLAPHSGLTRPPASMKKSKRQRIRILNPRDSAQLCTSPESAADLVRRGAAVYVTSQGQPMPATSHPGGASPCIRFIDGAERRRAWQADMALQTEISISRARGDLFFWDGCEPGAQTLPRPGKPFEPKPYEDPGRVSAGVSPSAFNPDHMRGPFVPGKFIVPMKSKVNQDARIQCP